MDEDDELEDLLAGNPSGSGMAPLLALASVGLRKLFGSGDVSSPDLDGVLLVHTDRLRDWSIFPRCQDMEGALTYGQYRAGSAELDRTRKRVRHLLKARRRLRAVDTERDETYHTEYLRLPRSLFRRKVRIALTHERRPGTRVECADGTTDHGPGGDGVTARAGWTRRRLTVRWVGPSRVVHAREIETLRARLAEASDEARKDIDEVDTSAFGHPVLFVSHRWDTEDHPDPNGSQLRRLRALRDCWLVYDYSSFPQLPRSDEEERRFTAILQSMHLLIRKVVVLAAPDYLTRGWLVFEYLTACLSADVVCDEVADPRFVAIRDWAATEAPLPTNMFRDSWESQQSNAINANLLSSVNAILPVYGGAGFRTRHDSTQVTQLLTTMLKRRLPPRKIHQTYMSEWKTVAWTDDDLAQAFRGEIEIPADTTLKIRPFDTDVPTRLGDAVDRSYRVRRMTAKDRTNTFALI